MIFDHCTAPLFKQKSDEAQTAESHFFLDEVSEMVHLLS